MFSIARKAASRLRFANIFGRAIGLTTNAATESHHAAEQHFPQSTLPIRHNPRGVRSHRRRISPALHNATTPGDPELVPNSRLLTNLRDQYRGATEVRTRVRRHNGLVKERSLQRVLRAESAAPSTSSTSGREFHVLAEDVREALVTSEVPKTREDLVFERGLAELVGDFVEARKVVDAEFAHSTFDRQDFLAQLEKERARVESAMAAKDEEAMEQREKREQEDREKALEEERQREKELERIRLLNQDRIREAEERRVEARRKAEQEEAKLAAEKHNRIAEERVRRLQAELEARLQEERRLRDQERQARVEAERIAQLERERVARLEEEARVAREREEQRLREEEHARAWIEAEAAKVDAQFRATVEEQARKEAHAHAERRAQWQREADEYARRRLDEYVQSIFDPETREEINQRFQAQEDRLRAQLEEAATAQAQEQWFYVQPEHYWQSQQEQHPPPQEFWSDFAQDIPMGDPSFSSNVDISMDSIPPAAVPPHFVLPKTDRDWFDLYESRWQALRGPTDPDADQLTFPSFPWPVFRLVGSLDELDDEEIKRFFTSRYPGRLDKNWKVELTRWHPDKVERLRGRIRPDSVESVREGFLKCAKVMTAFQEEKERT
jgi:hypothetical protein